MWRSVARNAVRSGFLPEMARKASGRLLDRDESQEAQEWCRRHECDLTAWATARSPTLWAEATIFADAMRSTASGIVRELEAEGVVMGGGGAYDLLYFLTRRLNPASVVETGVAAGWSTWAILAALDCNGMGELWSSDFPYFRLPEPEKWIGILVPDALRSGNWHLQTKGDRINLPAMLTEIPGAIDLVHYDSDKRRVGRRQFTNLVLPRMAEDAIFVMDDIGDDLFFRDQFGESAPSIFAVEGKYVGVVEFSH